MKTYRVEATVIVNVVTMVEAESEDEAQAIADGRDVSLCIHGSEFSDGDVPDDEFVLIDGGWDCLDLGDIEEVEIEEED